MKKTKPIFLALVLAAAAQCAQADVKVGFLATMSGPAAVAGIDQLDGFNLALEQLGGKLGGVRATVIKDDDQQKPEVALNALSKLLERDKVDVVTGFTFAHVLLALQGKIAASDVPFLGSLAGPSEIAGAQCKPNLFVMSWQSDAPAEAIGKYLNDKGVKRISTITMNFVGGKDKINGLKRFFKGEIAEEMYTPLSQMDFSAELSRISAAKPDAVYALYPGGMGVAFVRQYQQAGLAGKIPLYTTNMIDGTVLDAMGAAAVGAFIGDAWTPGHPGEESRRFVDAFRKKYNRLPSAYAAFSYDVAKVLDVAIRNVKGNTTDRKALAKAIATASFKSVRGPFRFGPNNFPIQNYHVYQVAAAGGKAEFKLLEADVLKAHSDPYAAQCVSR